MVSWAGDVVIEYHIRTNGRTAYEEMTGHRVMHGVAGFAERVHFKVATDNVQDKCNG